MPNAQRQPWDPDVTLEVDAVRGIVSRVRPDLSPVEVELLGAGWDFWAYLVNDRWVFRFPKREREQKRLRKEYGVLGLIDRALDVPTPRYEGLPLEDDAFPYVFGVYQKLEGTQAYQIPAANVDLDALGAVFGRELRKLHAIPRADVEAAYDVIPDLGREFPKLCDKSRDYFHWFPDGDVKLSDRMNTFFNAERELPARFEGTDVLLHTDPHAEHLLLDAEEPHRLAGIIDWGDVAFGDPALDVSGPYPWGGEPLLTATLDAYGGDDGLASRARFIGAYVALIELDYAKRLGRDAYAEALLDVLRSVPVR